MTKHYEQMSTAFLLTLLTSIGFATGALTLAFSLHLPLIFRAEGLDLIVGFAQFIALCLCVASLWATKAEIARRLALQQAVPGSTAPLRGAAP